MNTTAPAPHDLETFWDWSLRVYDHEDLAANLIALQDDFALNVNIMLWCCWCSLNFPDLPEILLRGAVDKTATWTNAVTGPIRTARRHVNKGMADQGTLREKLKSVELEAERVEQTILEKLVVSYFEDKQSRSTGTPVEAAHRQARQTIAKYAALSGAQKQDGFSVSLLEEVIDLIFKQHQTSKKEQSL